MEYIKAGLLGVAGMVMQFLDYVVVGVALTLGYYYGVDLHTWITSFK